MGCPLDYGECAGLPPVLVKRHTCNSFVMRTEEKRPNPLGRSCRKREGGHASETGEREQNLFPEQHLEARPTGRIRAPFLSWTLGKLDFPRGRSEFQVVVLEYS